MLESKKKVEEIKFTDVTAFWNVTFTFSYNIDLIVIIENRIQGKISSLLLMSNIPYMRKSF